MKHMYMNTRCGYMRIIAGLMVMVMIIVAISINPAFYSYVWAEDEELKESDIVFDVFQAGLDFIAGNVFDGKQILENIKDKILTDVSSHVELYCLYLYVSTLERKDALYTSDVLQIVSRYYDNGYDTWVLLWILFYIVIFQMELDFHLQQH